MNISNTSRSLEEKWDAEIIGKIQATRHQSISKTMVTIMEKEPLKYSRNEGGPLLKNKSAS